MDAIDLRILERLQNDARISNVELARAVNLSPSPCLARVRALEALGCIDRYVTLLDAKKLGLTVSVLVQVTLEKQIEPALEVFEKAVRERRGALGLKPVYKRVDTCAAEFDSFTPYMYGTYEAVCESNPNPRNKVVISGRDEATLERAPRGGPELVNMPASLAASH